MSDTIECPKCGRAVEAGAFICAVCEYILDTSFLGEDITDDERDKRKRTAPGGPGGLKKTVENPAQANAPAAQGMNSVNFGEDAIILGNGQGDYSDFETKDAGMTKEVTHARFYIGGSTAAILHVDAVPEIAPGLIEGSLKMSPFERHVLGFINGKRSIGRIQKKSAMEDSEFKTSVAMLADKGIIRLRTTKKRKNKDTGAGGIPSRSESSRVAPAPTSVGSGSGSSGGGALSADRTVVASFEQLSQEHERMLAEQALQKGSGSQAQLRGPLSDLGGAIAAAAALEDAVPTRAQVRGSRATAAEPTIIKSSGDPSRKKSAGGPGFASMRITGEHPAPPPPPIDADAALADEWGADDNPNNISNVFARAPSPAPKNKKRPSLADSPPVVSDRIEGDDEPGARPPPLPDETGDFEQQVDAEEFVPPGGDDDFLRGGKSKDHPILAAAKAADAEAARGTTGPQTGPQVAVKARTTSPGLEAEGEPPYSADAAIDDDDGVPAALRDPTGIGDLKPVDLRGGAPIDDDGTSSFAESPAVGDDGFVDDDAPGDDPEATASSAMPPARLSRDVKGRPAEPEEHDEEEDVETFIKAKRRSGKDEDIPATAPRPAVVARADAVPDGGGFDDDIPTGPLPPDDDENQDDIDVEDDDVAFDVEMRTAHLARIDSANTASLPAKDSIPNLPSDALQPLPSIARGAPVQPPPIPQAIPPAGAKEPPALSVAPMMPGAKAGVPLPAMPGVPGIPGMPGASSAPPPGLPGQRPALASPPSPAVPGLPGSSRPPTMKGGLPVQPRPSAGSKVPFEQARKAEKIFEQALKDHAEGRISSARMNAKLAAMYDPSIDQYQQFLKDLDAQGANAKAPGAGKPKELTLFEQASDAEGRGDFEKAVDLLEEAISLNPKAAALRNRLGVVLSIRLKRHTEAMEQLRIAIELEPGNIVYMNNFSKVTALLDSQLEKGPEDMKNKKKGKGGDEKVQIKKMRPKIF